MAWLGRNEQTRGEMGEELVREENRELMELAEEGALRQERQQEASAINPSLFRRIARRFRRR